MYVQVCGEGSTMQLAKRNERLLKVPSDTLRENYCNLSAKAGASEDNWGGYLLLESI